MKKTKNAQVPRLNLNNQQALVHLQEIHVCTCYGAQMWNKIQQNSYDIFPCIL